MKAKGHIGKIMLAAVWCTIGAGVLVLLIAAIKSRNHKTCQGYEIEIAGGGDHWFMDKKDIVQLLTGNGAYPIKGRAIRLFDLRKLEEKLEHDVWVKDAELFFDNNEVLRVKIVEREPLARVFTNTGNSFYIDSSGERLPLSDKLSAKLPVFTNFPTDKLQLNSADSLLMAGMRKVSAYLLRQPFWMSQIAQIDITPDKRFEMVPTVGDHIIEFGNGNDCDKKFGRLLTFYRKVLSKTGMNIYQRINVQFDRQVIGVRKGAAVSRFDSLQAARNVERLIASSQAIQQQGPAIDSVRAKPATTDTEKPPIDPKTVPARTNPGKKILPVKSRSYETRSNPVKSQPRKPPVEQPQPAGPQPKAVMPKRN